MYTSDCFFVKDEFRKKFFQLNSIGDQSGLYVCVETSLKDLNSESTACNVLPCFFQQFMHIQEMSF